MNVLVTRPEPDAAAQAQLLRDRGVHPIVSPLLSVALTPASMAVDDLIDDVAAVIATSRHAIKSLAKAKLPSAFYEKPLFCVGEATAKSARDIPFETFVSGGSNAAALAPVIAQHIRPDDGLLLRLVGDIPSAAPGRLTAQLRADGFRVHDVVNYCITPTPVLTDEAIAYMTDQRLDAVILMSPLTARTYVAAVTAAGLTVRSENLRYLCFSPAVADELSGIQPKSIKIAGKPKYSELLSLVDHTVAELS